MHAFANFVHLISDGMQLNRDLTLMLDNEIEKYPAECVCTLPISGTLAYLLLL